MDRYLITAYPAFALLHGAGVDRIPRRKIRQIAFVVLLASMLIGALQMYINDEIYARADWRALGNILEREPNSTTDVIATFHH
jgi:hypothetical protein